MKELHARARTGRDSRAIAEDIYDWVSAAVFSLAILSIILTSVIRIVGVDGMSMCNTLQDHDRLILSTVAYTPHRGDIVVINRYAKEPLVKRVVAVGGDSLYIDPDTYGVYRNGELLNEPYILGNTTPRELTEPITIPKGFVFVMGDNRENSLDSRFSEIGLIDEQDILGKAIFRVWPFSSFGGLKSVKEK